MPFTDSCRNVRVEGATLRADCRKLDNATYQDSSLPLDLVLGNINGEFKWGYKAFSETARNIRLDGSVLKASLQNSVGDWQDAEVNLDDFIANNDGVIQGVNLPIIIAIPDTVQEEFMNQLRTVLEEQPTCQITMLEQVAIPNRPDPATTFYVNAGADVSEGTVFKTWSADATASVMHVAKETGHPIERLNVDVLGANASAQIGGVKIGDTDIPTFAGVEASVNLVKAQASIFDLKLGLGLDTGAGLKDGSLEAEVGGCGVTIGKKVGISVLGNEFAIDFGRLFGF